MPRYKKYDYAQSILLPVEFKKQILPGTIEYLIDYMAKGLCRAYFDRAQYGSQLEGII